MQEFLLFFQLFFHCCLCIWNFHCLRHRNEFVHKTKMWENSSLLQWCDLDEVFVQLLPALVSCVRRHHQHKRSLSCDSQYCGGSLHCSLSVFYKALLLASDIPTFSLTTFGLPAGFSGTDSRAPRGDHLSARSWSLQRAHPLPAKPQLLPALTQAWLYIEPSYDRPVTQSIATPERLRGRSPA